MQELFNKHFGAFCPMHKVYLAMLSKIGLLMRSGADITIRNNSGMVALHNFASGGGLREIRALLAEYEGSGGVSREERELNWKRVINARDIAGRTPLWMACAHEKGLEPGTKVAQWLISRGADPSLGDEYGATPLHVAAALGNLPLATLLLKHGAPAHATTTRGGAQLFSGSSELVFPAGVSPLVVAKLQGHSHLVPLLLDALS